MLYQVTAYQVLDALQLQATTALATETGYRWEHRLLEHVPLPGWSLPEPDPWDVLWVIGSLLSERSIARRGEPPAR